MSCHCELTHGGVLTDLGELQNWSVLVDDLRHELVCWVHDYLMEFTVCSIYRARGRWLLNLEWRTGGRRGGIALEQEMCGFHHGRLPAMNQLSRAAYCDEVKLQGTWRPIGRWPTPANLFGPAPSLIHGEDLFTLKRYPTTNSTNRVAGTNPGAGVVGGKVHCTYNLLQLLYNQNTIQSV